MLVNGKEINIFICVPAVGKTKLAQMDKDFVDFDQERCFLKYGYDRNISQIDFERLKGNRGDRIGKYPEGYIQNAITNYSKQHKIILAAPSKDIVDYLVQNQIPYCLVYHSLDCEEEYRKRMKDRGNEDNFIEAMLGPLKTFYKESTNDTRPACKIELKPGQYLSDILIPLKKHIK